MNRLAILGCILITPACVRSVTLVPVSASKAESTRAFPRTWDETPLPQEQDPQPTTPTPSPEGAARQEAADPFARSAQSKAGPADEKKASMRFDEGLYLAEHGRPAEAASKFEESQRLDPGDGTLFHLAECYELMGKTASAWSLFVRVADSSREAKRPDREKLARARASVIEPKLSRLTITVSRQPSAQGFEVRRDRAVVLPAEWGVAIPVDPDTHVISAAAPGIAYWYTLKDVPWGGGIINVAVPVLVDALGAEPPARATEQAAGHPTSR